MKTLSREQFKKLYGEVGLSSLSKKKAGGVKGFATGVGKGVVESAVGTAKMTQRLGQAAIAAVDPTRTYSQVERTTGFPTLRKDTDKYQNELLKADNTAEKAGKVAAFGAELLMPAETANIARKGAEAGAEVVQRAFSRGLLTAEDAVKKGRNAVEKAQMLATEIDDRVANALGRTSVDTFDKYYTQAIKATKETAQQTPLELAGKKAEEALQTVQKKLESFGVQKSQAINSAKASIEDVKKVVDRTRLQLGKYAQKEMLDSTDRTLVTDIYSKLAKIGDKPTAKQLDELIDYAQGQLYKAQSNLLVKTGDATSQFLKKTIGEANSQLKKLVGGSYGKLNARYSDVIEVRNWLNKMLGAEGNKGGALLKRVFSPSDAGTKEMFDEIYRLTGINLSDHATLAKFLMETVGDARQRSILESLLQQSVNKNPGWLSNVLDKGLIKGSLKTGREKLKKPIDKARTLLEKSDRIGR